MSCDCDRVSQNTQTSVCSIPKSYQKRTVKQPFKDKQRHEIWERRNNSTQMNALLNPNVYEDSGTECECCAVHPTSVKKTRSKIKWPVHNKGISKYHANCVDNKPKSPIMRKKKIHPTVASRTCVGAKGKNSNVFKNECYCNRSKKSLEYTETSDQPKICKSLTSESCHSLSTIQKARELLTYSPESAFLRKMRDATKSCKCENCRRDEVKEEPLRFTARRSALEKAYEDLPRNCHSCNDAHSTSDCECKCRRARERSCCSLHTSNARNCDRISKVQSIRKRNYFECHSTEKLLDVPEHKCVHQFFLDDRLLPEAMNPDAYGVSRCEICNKPMRDESSNKKLDNIAATRRGCAACSERAAPRKKLGVTYRKIRIEGKNDIVELHVPEAALAEPKPVRFHRPQTCHNSWALRYQKGVL